MSTNYSPDKLMTVLLPTFLGLGVGWLSVNLLRNEKKLAFRKIELEGALNAKSNRDRKELLLGK